MATGRRVLVIDDSPVMARCLAAGLAVVGDHAVTVQADPVRSPSYDVAVITVDGGAGLDTARVGRLVRVGRPVICLSATAGPADVAAYLRVGALAVLSSVRVFDDLIRAVHELIVEPRPLSDTARDALSPGPLGTDGVDALYERLTPAERTVLAMLRAGIGAERIAVERSVSIHTVRAQIRAILSKLGVNSQLAAVAVAHQRNWSP